MGSPVALRTIRYRNDKPAKSRILLDDLYFIADMSDPARQLVVRTGLRAARLCSRHSSDDEFSGCGTPGRKRYGLRWSFEFSILSGSVYAGANSLPGLRPEDLPGFSSTWERLRKKGDTDRTQGRQRICLASTFGGWLGVFKPNNGRFNRIPMWFGIEDQEVNTAPYEAGLHVSWMKLLGIDMIRGGLLGHGVEGARGTSIGFDGYRELWKPHVEAGLDICLDYAGRHPRLDTRNGTEAGWCTLAGGPESGTFPGTHPACRGIRQNDACHPIFRMVQRAESFAQSEYGGVF